MSEGFINTEAVKHSGEHNARLLSEEQQKQVALEKEISDFGMTLKEIYELAKNLTLRSGQAEVDNGEGMVATLKRLESDDDDEDVKMSVSVRRDDLEEVGGLTLTAENKFKFTGGNEYRHTAENFKQMRDAAPVKKINLVAEAFGLK